MHIQHNKKLDLVRHKRLCLTHVCNPLTFLQPLNEFTAENNGINMNNLSKLHHHHLIID